jgi:hypothetical protein
MLVQVVPVEREEREVTEGRAVRPEIPAAQAQEELEATVEVVEMEATEEFL